MSLPYESSTAGDKALGEIQKTLRGGVIWSSECRHKFELLDGRPSDYEMRWCPFCGGELVHDRFAGMED